MFEYLSSQVIYGLLVSPTLTFFLSFGFYFFLYKTVVKVSIFNQHQSTISFGFEVQIPMKRVLDKANWARYLQSNIFLFGRKKSSKHKTQQNENVNKKSSQKYFDVHDVLGPSQSIEFQSNPRTMVARVTISSTVFTATNTMIIAMITTISITITVTTITVTITIIITVIIIRIISNDLAGFPHFPRDWIHCGLNASHAYS